MTTCLVVDDSSVVRKVARRMLEKLSIEVREAENGVVAMERCTEAMPDAILLDWNMPVATGPEFLKALRGREDGAAPRVIFCTTENDLDHIAAALESGADEYIMKPYDADILREKLEAVGVLEAAA
ncbi:response regulator [Afifella sp. IM 167]|uniref:response regulator n=1 Tax=Afifella sp. IM 167 TaxID=2033586 RepID=UPI001CCB2DE6|nr:response regulator [Afifella sp. IM 167]MBZ8131816.1 two-component system response regulator [Afifella sp. IM 167]